MKTLIATIVAISLIGCGEPEPDGDTNIFTQKGDQGEVGSKGDTGDIGPKGDTGNIGLRGETGETGSKGDTGDIGSTGSIGEQGVTGAQGVTGERGINGLKGAPGPRGIQGVSGAQVVIRSGGLMIGYPVMVDSAGKGTWQAVYAHRDLPPSDFPVGGHILTHDDMFAVYYTGPDCTGRAYIIETIDGTQGPSFNYINMLYSVEGSDVLWLAIDPTPGGWHYDSSMQGAVCNNDNVYSRWGVRVEETTFKLDKSGPWFMYVSM